MQLFYNCNLGPNLELFTLLFPLGVYSCIIIGIFRIAVAVAVAVDLFDNLSTSDVRSPLCNPYVL